MASTLVKSSISVALGQALIDDIFLQKSKYYYSLGRSYLWDNNDTPPNVVDTENYENISRADALLFKRIDGTSVSFVVPRINYTKNVVYEIYDDSIPLDGKQFYVLTSDFNVYKCLHNNGNRPSTVEPFGVSSSSVTYSDGYVWKFIYTITPALRNKFLSATSMPVYNAITERYYSAGSLTNTIINSGGVGYTDINTSILIKGDGYLEYNPQKLIAFSLASGGSGYTIQPSVQTDDIFANNTTFAPNSSVLQNQILEVSDVSGIRYYKVESAGVTGNTAPSNYYSIVNNGTATVRHVGTKPKITASFNPQTVGSVRITQPGFGYTSTPSASAPGGTVAAVLSPILSESSSLSVIQVSSGGAGYTTTEINIDSPFPAAINFSASSIVFINDILSYFNGTDTYFYRVENTGTTGVTAPEHTTGTILNGTVMLTVVGIQARAESILGVITGITPYYDIASVKVTNSGSGYIASSEYNWDTAGQNWEDLGNEFSINPDIQVNFVGGNPQIPAQATAIVSDGQVKKIIILYPGYGYESAPTVEIVGNGINASAVAELQYGYGYQTRPRLVFSIPDNQYGDIALGDTLAEKTEAILEPVIIDGVIRGINIIDAGVGYTTAKLTVIGDGVDAALTPVFVSGDLTTIQAQSELFAVPGTISSVNVEDQGDNITSIGLTITGDGSGAEIQAVLLNGKLDQVKVISEGSGYTYATVTAMVNVGATTPNLRAIISPIAGHGSNPIRELFTKSVALYSAFSDETNNGFSPDNMYRQVCIIKNPQKNNSNRLLESKIASACLVVDGNLSGIPLEDGLILTSTIDSSEYRVVTFTTGKILLQPLTKINIELNSILSFTINNITYNIVVSDFTLPQVNKYSGELLYIDNLRAFAPSENQSISISTIINLL